MDVTVVFLLHGERSRLCAVPPHCSGRETVGWAESPTGFPEVAPGARPSGIFTRIRWTKSNEACIRSMRRARPPWRSTPTGKDPGMSPAAAWLIPGNHVGWDAKLIRPPCFPNLALSPILLPARSRSWRGHPGSRGCREPQPVPVRSFESWRRRRFNLNCARRDPGSRIRSAGKQWGGGQARARVADGRPCARHVRPSVGFLAVGLAMA